MEVKRAVFGDCDRTVPYLHPYLEVRIEFRKHSAISLAVALHAQVKRVVQAHPQHRLRKALDDAARYLKTVLSLMADSLLKPSMVAVLPFEWNIL